MCWTYVAVAVEVYYLISPVSSLKLQGYIVQAFGQIVLISING